MAKRSLSATTGDIRDSVRSVQTLMSTRATWVPGWVFLARKPSRGDSLTPCSDRHHSTLCSAPSALQCLGRQPSCRAGFFWPEYHHMSGDSSASSRDPRCDASTRRQATASPAALFWPGKRGAVLARSWHVIWHNCSLLPSKLHFATSFSPFHHPHFLATTSRITDF